MFIQEVELFEEIPSHIIHEIAQFAKEENYPAGHLLFREGDSAEFLYILEEGRVAITIPGREGIAFSVTQSGSLFGWSAIVEPRRYTAGAELTKNSKVLKIDGERMLHLLEKHPHEGLIIMRRLAGIISTRLTLSYQKFAVIQSV